MITTIVRRARVLLDLARGLGFAETCSRVARRLRSTADRRRSPEGQIRHWVQKAAHAGAGGATVTRNRAPVRVLVYGHGDADRTAASLRRAALPHWTLNEPGAPLPSPAGGERYLAIAAGDEFISEALPAFASALDSVDPEDVVYADEVQEDPRGTLRGDLKPAWSPVLALTRAGRYPGAATAIPAAPSFGAIGAGTRWLDVLLKTTNADSRVHHLPMPVLRRHDSSGDVLFGSREERRGAVERALIERDIPADVTDGADPDSFDVHLKPDRWPFVSIILPTRDQPQLLTRLLDALDRLPEDCPHEVILVDHLTRDPTALQRLRKADCRANQRVLQADGPFNFSRLVNLGAAQATGDLLLLLNNDVEPMDLDWFPRLVAASAWDNVHAVGAHLRYPDGECQHAGIGVGVGIVGGHLGKQPGTKEVFPGTGPLTTREVGAVTGACLLVRRDAFDAANGLDEQQLPVSFNDVDLCLKIRRSGGTVLYEPAASLIHHETRSRSPRLDPTEIRAMLDRWGPLDDPYLPAALNRESENPFLATSRAPRAGALR